VHACDSPEQEAHDHTLGPELGASFLTRILAGLRVEAGILFIVIEFHYYSGSRGLMRNQTGFMRG
jgi:hypothetical protein